MRQVIGFALALMLATALPPAASAQQDDATLAADRLAIENTMHDYIVALDGSNLDAYLATLTDDARFLSKEGNYHGKQAIADYVRPVMENRLRRAADGTATDKGTRHIVTNTALHFRDANHAVMRSYWMFAVAQKEGGVAISLIGSAEDHFVKQDGRWLIEERHVETL